MYGFRAKSLQRSTTMSLINKILIKSNITNTFCTDISCVHLALKVYLLDETKFPHMLTNTNYESRIS